ncbi:MAG: hypothetical protein M3414_02535 [Pseudomonadota bacterium]|nr:hypothetical protein [Pseudomonadota bacterium]
MNLQTSNRRASSIPSVPASLVSAKGSSRPQRRERDFGVGYGTSSGYASSRRYIGENGPRLFRCA